MQIKAHVGRARHYKAGDGSTPTPPGRRVFFFLVFALRAVNCVDRNNVSSRRLGGKMTDVATVEVVIKSSKKPASKRKRQT